MSVDHDAWRRAEELFHAALERPPDDRRAFLDRSCGDDPDLRRLVETLVSKDGDHPSFLKNPAFATDRLTTRVSRPPWPRRRTRVAPDCRCRASHSSAASSGRTASFRFSAPAGWVRLYRAHDSKLDRDVAIKMLPVEFARDPGRLARFRREARVLASLNHPNIAAIYGLEEAAEGDYLVLELVEGDQLHGPLPVPAAIDLACQVADALEAAHRHGIVHRDLKPANVKLTPEGRVKVLDFGLAKAIAGGEPAPMLAGQMPPSQRRQRDRERSRHARLHEPRAGARRGRRSADGHLGVRVPLVRTADGTPRIREPHRVRRGRRRPRARAGLARCSPRTRLPGSATC